jgi:hydroxymethylpyrimidine pyrophosphatase-like HAD family hydrolase
LLERSRWRPRDLPSVTLNGAVVYGGDPHRRLAYNVLDRTTLERLVRMFQDAGALPAVFGLDEEGGWLHLPRSEPNEIMAVYLRHRRDRIGRIAWLDDPVADLPDHGLEVGTIDLAAVIQPLTEAIGRELPDVVKVINTRSLLGGGRYYWAEVYHHGCSKGTGVRQLATAHAVSPGRIVAIGDNFNDLDMFAAATVSVAMGDGPVEVRQRADRVTGPVAESGAAAVLEQIATGRFSLESNGGREAV